MIVPTMEELQAFNIGRPFFGKFLREARVERKISLISAAKSCGINPFEWSDLEHGRRNATQEELGKIAKALDMSEAMLMINQSRLNHEQDLWLQKHPKVVQWLKALSEKER